MLSLIEVQFYRETHDTMTIIRRLNKIQILNLF